MLSGTIFLWKFLFHGFRFEQTFHMTLCFEQDYCIDPTLNLYEGLYPRNHLVLFPGISGIWLIAVPFLIDLQGDLLYA